jgi:ABC transporter DrrB family efflux protein
MTTTDLPSSPNASPTAPAGRPAAPRAKGAGFVTTALTTARRTLLQFFRTPQTLFMGTIQGAMFLFMFRYVFGYAISTRGGLSYVDWMVPGFLVTAILWTGMGASAGVAEESSSGVYDRFRSLPIPRSAVMLGRSIADAGLVVWGVMTTAVIGYLVGFRAHGSIGQVVLAFLLIFVAGWAISWVFITLGLLAGNAQAAQGMGMLVVPFSFISSANVPVASMPGWMQPFAANQPISVMINAVRCLMQGGPDAVGIGHSTGYWVVLSLIWCAGIAVVFGAIATRLFSKMR